MINIRWPFLQINSHIGFHFYKWPPNDHQLIDTCHGLREIRLLVITNVIYEYYVDG
jgi:hypothetical protein